MIGEGLLLAGLVCAPWIYGAVEDSVRYALCAVVVLAASLFGWPNLRERTTPNRVGLVLALMAFGMAQILLGQSVAKFLTVEAAMVAFALAMVWAAVDSRAGSTSTNTARRVAMALLLVCATEAGFAAFQWSTDRQALFGQRSEFQTMPFGSYVNHNNFAGLVSLGVPLAVAMAIGDLRRSGRLTPRGLALMGLASGLAITVFASGSRGGALAMVFGLGVLAWLARGMRHHRHEVHRQPWRGPLHLGVLIVVVAALAIPASTRDRLARVFTLGFEPGDSVSYRLDMAVASFRAFKERPLMGWGLGAFADAAAPFKLGHGDVRSERAEADLIEFFVEGGLILVAGLVWFGRFAWKSATGEMARARDRSGKWLRAGALAACCTMVFHSLFDFGFRIPANALAFAALLGVTTASSERPARSSALKSGGLIGLMVIAALACGYRSVGAAGERAALARTSPESRLDALVPLVDAHPYLDRARRQRGLAWLALAYSQGRYDPLRLQRARADFEAVVRLRPRWGEARTDLGWAKYYAGDTAGAIEEMRRAAALDPTHVGVGIACAQVLSWSGDTLAAIEALKRLRRSNPAWPQASARELASSWTKDASILADIP